MEYSGGGDPRRSIELLWGIQERPKRGPKPRLTVAEIVRAAIEIADAEGLPALSMRQVADRLGVATMSIYTYVPGKSELVDLMLDRAYGETARPDDVPGGWRARLELVAREKWALYLRHPWILQVAQARPPLGPNTLARYDYELRAVDGTGLTDIEIDSVVTLIDGFVAGVARGAVEASLAAQRTGVSDQRWWEAVAPLLEKVFEPERHPTAARVGAAAGAAYGAAYDYEHSFEFGLRRVLDGIEVLIASRTP